MTTGSPTTIAFIDLTGSTAAFEALGNAQVADVISKITRWAGRVCEAHGGTVVKFLGDGVLARFADGAQGVQAAIFLQQNHTERLLKWPEPLRMGMKIGLAAGDVVELGDDSYGDAVNTAARLCEMAGAHAIWVDEAVIDQIRAERDAHRSGRRAPTDPAQMQGDIDAVRYRSLGMIRIRGMVQPRSVFQVEWNEDVTSDLMTVRGGLHDLADGSASEVGPGTSTIALSWLGSSKLVGSHEMPMIVGRIPNSGFVVSDQRVSRQHGQLEWVNGAFVYTDLSSFGSWVRFMDNPASETQLRRNQCVLHSTGEIALGAPFSDFSAPVIAFHVRTEATPMAQRELTPSLFGDSRG